MPGRTKTARLAAKERTTGQKDDVIAVFQSLGVNPIMNQPENPDAASLVIDVPTDEQVSGGSFNPWGPHRSNGIQ